MENTVFFRIDHFYSINGPIVAVVSKEVNFKPVGQITILRLAGKFVFVGTPSISEEWKARILAQYGVQYA